MTTFDNLLEDEARLREMGEQLGYFTKVEKDIDDMLRHDLTTGESLWPERPRYHPNSVLLTYQPVPKRRRILDDSWCLLMFSAVQALVIVLSWHHTFAIWPASFVMGYFVSQTINSFRKKVSRNGRNKPSRAKTS
jgi:hypothetical protein